MSNVYCLSTGPLERIVEPELIDGLNPKMESNAVHEK